MRDPLDIAICTLGLPITGEDPARIALGGSETAALSMAHALKRAEHRVRVFCNTPGPTCVDGVEIIPATELGPRLDREPCDLLVSSRYHQLLEQPLSARMVGLWNHDMPAADFTRMYARGLSRASFSMFVSRFHADEYEKRVPELSPRSWVTSNGIDFDALEKAAGRAQRAEGPPLFIYGSRPERGLLLLLKRIWPRVLERYPDARLLVSSYDTSTLGTPPGFEELYDSCRRTIDGMDGVVGMGSLVRCDYWAELARCSAVLYPTDFPEVSCMVALEAQAAGVPIVTTGAFALNETVGFEETLVREPYGSDAYIDEFLARVYRVVEEDAFRDEGRAAGRRHVSRESHSWDAIAGRWTEFFFEQFRERFESDRAGVLRGLLRESQEAAAYRLVASVDDPESVFRSRDLTELRERAGSGSQVVGPAPDVNERVFRVRPVPTVSATILVKDEEANVRRCIESFEGLVDEILVGDTGSSDLTVDILRSMGFAEDSDTRRLLQLDFTDFSQARNDLAAHATGDYVYWQDADEVLDGAQDLRRWIDENVFYDGLAIEQRHLSFDKPIDSDHPLRCFRPATVDGPLQWIGCVHEHVEHDVNRPPARVLVVPEIFVGHFGYARKDVRLSKARNRNLNLIRRDREMYPARMMGFIFGMREYLNLAKYDLSDTGGMTAEGYRCLNLGWQVWDRHVKKYPEIYRRLGFWISREILATLAAWNLPLRSTGQVPFEADYSFSARRGKLDCEGSEIPRQRLFYASVDELREEFNDRFDQLEWQLGDGKVRPAESLPPSSDRSVERDLPPTLFDIDEEWPATIESSSRVRPIVSLTTIPSRLNQLSATIETLLSQTLPPEKILVAIPRSCRNRDGRLRQTEYGELPAFLDHPSIEVLRCEEDLGSLTKLIPALQALRAAGDEDRSLITVDDDARYAPNLLEELVAAGEKFPGHVIATEGERIDRPHTLRFTAPGHVLSDCHSIDIMQGCGGVLYRNSFFGDDFFDTSALESVPECMGEDDYWTAGYLALRGVRKLHIAGPAYYEVIEETQNEALCNEDPWVKREAVIRHFQSLGLWQDHWRFGVSRRTGARPAPANRTRPRPDTVP